MIEKKDFYHGAVLHELLESNGNLSIKIEGSGYLLNESTYLYIKHSTKNKTPWGFVLSHEETDVLKAYSAKYRSSLALVCGGDGICIIDFDALSQICGQLGGWISVKRAWGRMYSISGPIAEYSRKIPCKPIFDLKTFTL